MALTIKLIGTDQFLQALGDKEQQINTKMKKVAIEIFRRIILKTPVDTGQARNNWFTTINTPSTDMTEEIDKSGQKAIKDMVAKVLETKFTDKQIVYISNNLPYIDVLENGSSDQAPSGMVKTTVAEFGSIVREVD